MSSDESTTIEDLKSNWVNKGDFGSFMDLANQINLRICSDIHNSDKLTDIINDIKKITYNQSKLNAETNYLKSYLNGLSNIILEFQDISNYYYEIDDDAIDDKIDSFLNSIMKNSLNDTNQYDELFEKILFDEDLSNKLLLEKDFLRKYFLNEFFKNMKEKQYEQLHKIIKAFEIFAYIIKEKDNDEGNYLLKTYDHMSDLLSAMYDMGHTNGLLKSESVS